MIQIRKKKEQQRKDIRREFLDNYFREMRRNCFGFEGVGNGQEERQKGVLEVILVESLKHNCIAQRLRKDGLGAELQGLVRNAIETGNLLETKILLTILSNALKDELTVDEKIAMFRLSSKLFQSLNLFPINKQIKPQLQHFQTTVKILHLQTLTFYMYTANQTSPFLDQQDQIKIQQQIFPVFANVFIHACRNSEELTNIDEFQRDVGRFFRSVFDSTEAFYEQGNRMKAQRLLVFYHQIMKEHLWLLQNCQLFAQIFANIQIILFKAYLKLIEILGDLPQFFISKQFFAIVQFTLTKCSRKQTQTQLNFVYSILHTFIDNKIMLQDVQNLLLTKDHKTDIIAFEKAINLVIENSEVQHRSLEMIEAVVICLFEENQFREIVERYEIRLVDMCSEVLNRFQKQMIGQEKHRKIVARALAIMRVLAEKQNIQGKKNNVSLVRRFQSQSGKKALQSISSCFYEVDVGDDMDITNCIEYIEEIYQIIDLDIQIQIPNL